jgi:hypothetical protein
MKKTIKELQEQFEARFKHMFTFKKNPDDRFVKKKYIIEIKYFSNSEEYEKYSNNFDKDYYLERVENLYQKSIYTWKLKRIKELEEK